MGYTVYSGDRVQLLDDANPAKNKARLHSSLNPPHPIDDTHHCCS